MRSCHQALMNKRKCDDDDDDDDDDNELIKLVQGIYRKSPSADKKITEYFHTKSGVQQRYILSPYLFILILEAVMSLSINNTQAGIKSPYHIHHFECLWSASNSSFCLFFAAICLLALLGRRSLPSLLPVTVTVNGGFLNIGLLTKSGPGLQAIMMQIDETNHPICPNDQYR